MPSPTRPRAGHVCVYGRAPIALSHLACDLIALKDTVAGTHARRLFNQALGTSTR